MDDNKKWYQSKGVWGGLAAVVAGVGAAFGLDLDAGQLTEVMLALGAAVGGIIAIIGRMKASKKIG